jgi:hypothetical protein
MGLQMQMRQKMQKPQDEAAAIMEVEEEASNELDLEYLHHAVNLISSLIFPLCISKSRFPVFMTVNPGNRGLVL